ncbi:MAG: CDP-alcohol phosphatidyltransferase family protein [Pseudomonadota bacterium]
MQAAETSPEDGPAPTVFSELPADRLARQIARLDAGVRPLMRLRDDHAFTNDVVDSLAAADPGTVLVDGAGRAIGARLSGDDDAALAAMVADRTFPPEGARALDAAVLVGRYDRKLRKLASPVALPAAGPGTERALFDASYKGVTDLVTKRVWPRPAFAAVRWCARRGVTPNQVTAASALLVLATFAFFWHGWFWSGIVAGWLMCFLDTVDGKLARVTLTSSRWGDIADHGIDLIHPPFWWWAWAVGAGMGGDATGAEALLALALGVIVAGYVAQRAEEGWFIARFGADMHTWRPFDSAFREVTARRNPNLLILMAFLALGMPAAGLVAVAAWVAISFVVHLVRIVQAHLAARRGAVVSWMAAP